MTDEGSEKCLCHFSEELCPLHGRELATEERTALLRDGLELVDELDAAALNETIDEPIKEKLVALLKSDLAIPHEVRDFLARAIAGKAEFWRLDFVSTRPGPHRTTERLKSARLRNKLLQDVASAALVKVETENEPVEAAVADVMARAGVTRAKAYAAIKKERLTKAAFERAVIRIVPLSDEN